MVDKGYIERLVREDLFGTRVEEDYSTIKRLLLIGRKKGYVTYDDIHQLFPEVEQDFEQLENAFATLLSAGIPYLDEEDTREPSDLELKAEEADRKQSYKKQSSNDDNRLANIDTNDMIGLYLKEVGQIPLLTREQEVELAQRIERGRVALGTFSSAPPKWFHFRGFLRRQRPPTAIQGCIPAYMRRCSGAICSSASPRCRGCGRAACRQRYLQTR